MSEERPSLVSLLIKLMKLRVIVLLQITAICAILVHDSLARYDLIDIERTWFDTIWTSFITLIGGTLSAGGSNAINMWYDRDIRYEDATNTTSSSANGTSSAINCSIVWCVHLHRWFFLLLPLALEGSVLVVLFCRILRIHLHDVAEAKDATKHRDWWCSRSNATTHWLGRCGC